MSALLDSLAGSFDGDARRKVALDAVLRDGLPGPRSETWKYTSLRALERREFATPTNEIPDFDDDILAGIPSPRMVFVNGLLDTARSDMGGLPDGVSLLENDAEPGIPSHAGADSSSESVFARLNTALASDGVRLRAASGTGTTTGTPLHLVFVATAADVDLAWHLRHRIELEAGASLAIVEHQLADGEHRHLENTVMELQIGADARLDHVRIQSAADGHTSFLRTDAKLAESARYQRLDIELGGALSRHELNVRLEGEGAQLVANGVLLAAGRCHLDTRLGIEHIARDTTCLLQWRGIGAGRARVVFHGGITIHAGADGSDAALSNKNLLLGNAAEVDTQPVLVIHADEVKAAHGATVGQLDPTALFYLRTRGLPLEQAKRLLTTAFVREPLRVIKSEAARDFVQARLDSALEILVQE